MKTYRVKITGVSDLFYGRHVATKKTNEETHENYEERTWKEKVHADENGQCFIPPFAIKNGLEGAGAWLSMGIPGEGKKTFTKRFASGVLVQDRMMLTNGNGKPVMLDRDVVPVPLFVPVDGKRGGGKRVIRIFPSVQHWSGDVEIIVLDEKIGEKVLLTHLETFGKFVGVGSMRVGNGGINGRFGVDSLELVSES